MNNVTQQFVNRVPHILLLYWVIKIAATTLGETGADMFSMTLGMGYDVTIAIFMAMFIVCLVVKLNMARYSPVMYWLTFTATAIAGTAISDYIDRTLGLGYTVGMLMLMSLLIIVLWLWFVKEKSLSVEVITTHSAECFYWLAFLVANTLGTAAGDFLADELMLGFMVSAAIISVLLVLTALAHYVTKISGVVLFWIAFVLTRPFGATFGDLLTKPVENGGFELGTFWASLLFAVILVFALVREVVVERKIYQNRPAP